MVERVVNPCFYCEVTNKVKRFISDTSNLIISLKNHILKGYDLTTIVHILRQVLSLSDHIHNMLVEIVGLTNN